jgi:mono/diheme cytochrome c family protein
MRVLIKFISLLAGLSVLVFANDSMFEMGKRIYEQTCISCHGSTGSADTNISLVVKPRSLRETLLNEKQTYLIIKHGAKYWGAASDMMPPFEMIYDDKQLYAVAHYISKAFNPDVTQRVEKLYAQSDAIAPSHHAKMLKRGEKIFKRNCSWCHGLDGKGDGEATRNPEKSIYPYDLGKTLLSNEQMFLYAKYGGAFFGTNKDDMPSWKKKYDDYTLKSVISYIDATFRGGGV